MKIEVELKDYELIDAITLGNLVEMYEINSELLSNFADRYSLKLHEISDKKDAKRIRKYLRAVIRYMCTPDHFERLNLDGR